MTTATHQISRRSITAHFAGGIISFDPALVSNRIQREAFAIAFDHKDPRKSGGYFIRGNGEIVRVGGAKLPTLGALLESLPVEAIALHA